MAFGEASLARMRRLTNVIHARTAGRGKTAVSFTSQPEPRTIGSFSRGRQLCAGNFMFAGYLVEAPSTSIWDLPIPDAAFEAEIHGFIWLDDLAAVGDGPARQRAQDWTHDWVRRFGRGQGPGWSPDLTGRRLIRWINHAIFLLNGQEKAASDAFFSSLSRQTNYLARRWRTASKGLPRFEALTGLIYSGLALDGMEDHVDPIVKTLAQECADQVDGEGGIPTRNPEELLEVFTLLNWAVAALEDTGKTPGAHHLAAIERIAPALRALRHTDGSLARFHGGGRGMDGKLDQSLATSGVRRLKKKGLAMGFARLANGRTSIIVDAASPPKGRNSANAHASTLAFELTSGRRPVIVNCGSGVSFGTTWRRAGRATPSHSTLGIEGFSSSRLGDPRRVRGRETELLIEAPENVRAEVRESEDGSEFVSGHGGYSRTHGLTHVRKLMLSVDGRSLGGEDTLVTLDKADEGRFDKVFDASMLQGIPFHIRFHLHPDVDAEIDLGGSTVSLELKSGEVWVFQHSGRARLSLEQSVFLERGRLAPRVTQQIVLSSAAMDYATRVSWTLAKTQDTPSNIRDLVYEDALAIE